MKQKGLVGALTLGMLLLAFSMMVPGTSQAISSKDLASIHGGACKAVCKSSTACAGDANGCVGNCKGASSGALCGTEGITNETNWYCGAPIEDGADVIWEVQHLEKKPSNVHAMVAVTAVAQTPAWCVIIIPRVR